MAKKAKSTAKKTSAGNKAKAPARVRVSVQMVAQFVLHLKQLGHDQAFMDDPASTKVFLTMDTKCVAFVKKFIQAKKLPNPNHTFKLLAAQPKGPAATAKEVPGCPCFPV